MHTPTYFWLHVRVAFVSVPTMLVVIAHQLREVSKIVIHDC